MSKLSHFGKSAECQRIYVEDGHIQVLGHFDPKTHIDSLLLRTFTVIEGRYLYSDFTSPDRKWYKIDIHYTPALLSCALFREELRNLQLLAYGVLTEKLPKFNYALKTTPQIFKCYTYDVCSTVLDFRLSTEGLDTSK